MNLDMVRLEEQIKILIQYKNVVDVSSIVSKTNLAGKITYVNGEFCRISGYSAEELIGNSHNIVRHPDMSNAIFKDLWKTILSKNIWQGTIKNKAKNGEEYIVSTTIYPILDIKGEIIEFISIRHDITELVQLRDKFKDQSVKDCLTGLHNRSYFQKMVTTRFEELANTKKEHALILFDIDNFKQINDQYGHDIGDKLLIWLGEKIRNVLREEDVFCRIGGDEFAVICEASLGNAKRIARKIQQVIWREPIEIGEKITLSFGIAPFKASETIEIIYKNADIALYRAKHRGKNCIELHEF